MVLTILRACYVSAAVHVSLEKLQVVKTSDMGNGNLGDGCFKQFEKCKTSALIALDGIRIKVMIYI